MEQKSENILNVPNFLTMIRILLIPVYWVLMIDRNDRIYALIIFIIASLTDLLDGYIARKFNLITDFGKLMDPLADKLMVISVLASMIIKHIVPLYVLFVVLVKELIMIIGGVYMLKKGIVVYSKTLGKAAQATLVFALLLCFFNKEFDSMGFSIHYVVLASGVALTLAALISYTVSAIKHLKE